MAENKNIIHKVMGNRQIVFSIVIVLVLSGIYALYKMPRQEFPKFTVRQGLVIGVYPGATSAQVEEQLTTVVEKYIFEFQEVNLEKTYSLSRGNVMIIFVELRDEVNKVDTDAFWAKLSHGLNALKQELPPGVTSLSANNNFGDTSALLLTISTEGRTYKELEHYLKQLENELRKLPAVSKIRHSGIQKEQIGIYIDDAKLAQYGVKPLTLLGALKMEGEVNYAGELDNGKIIMPIHIGERYHTESDVAEQIVYSDPMGNVIRLKDVATIVREYAEPESFVRMNGKKAVILSLEMQFGNNIVHFGKEVDHIIQAFTATLPDDITIVRIADMPEVVDRAISDFLKEFSIAIIAVILVTVILLPRAVALIAAISIPITILITLTVLYLWGIELNTVTLAALIIVLGMVVDNAIVVIDNHIEKLDSGMRPWDAASKSASELFVPVLTATLAIICVFMPLQYFLTGMAADFLETFPITIAVALLLSFVVAVFFIPIINFLFIKKGLKKSASSRPGILDIMQRIYDSTFKLTFKMPRLSILVGGLAVAGGIYLISLVPQQLFPEVERNQFAVEIYLPTSSSLQRTERVVAELESILRKDARVETVTAFIGAGSPRFHTTYAPNMPSKAYAQLIVNTISNQATEEILNEYDKKYRNFFPEAYVRWKQLAMNPTRAPIEVRISGNDIEEIKQMASSVTDIMHQAPHVAWVRNNFEEATQVAPSNSSVSVDIKKDEANRLGFSKTVLAYSLAIGTKGLPLSTIWEDDYPVDIVLHVDKKIKSTYNDLMDQHITSPFFNSFTQLRQIAEISPQWTPYQIVRRNGVRTITVSVDVDREVYASNVLKIVKPQIDQLKLPPDIEIRHGGEYEASMEDYIPMAYSLVIGIFLIFFILLFQFKKIKTVVIVMLAIPFIFLGAGIGLLIMDLPFGFTSFMGIMGLSGLVVRNGIILVDYAEKLRNSANLDIKEAAMAAGKRRMRPIFLTSAAAAIGVIPMILARSPLWAPLATVICFGLIFTMVLTLYIQPVLYMYFNRSNNK